MDNEMGFQKKHFDAVENLNQKPNRIESIKERISNYENAHTREEETIAWRQVDAYAVPDIKYLLQRLEHYDAALKEIDELIEQNKKLLTKLERYEKALKEISEVDNTWDEPLPTVMRRLAKEALKDEIT